MIRKPGRTRRKLAELLQKNFPTTWDGRVPVTWHPEWLYPAKGSYRTNINLDCYRWEGFAKHLDEHGQEVFTVFAVGSLYPMGELLKYADLEMDKDGEITPAVTPNADVTGLAPRKDDK